MILVFADCTLDTDRRALTRAGDPVKVEPQVFDLIALLAQHPDRVVTRDEIVAAVWGGRIVSESAISARIAAARKAVGDDGKRQAVIRTVARRGLQMVADVDTGGLLAQPAAAGEVRQRIRYTRDSDGRSIAYALTGAGTPVLRIGYNTTHLEAEWNSPTERRLFDAIAERHRLLRYDPVGFGMSDRGDIEIDFARMADDIVRVADAAGIDRFAAYSESGGIFPAIHLAARHPDRVARLAIIGGYANGRARRGAADMPRTFQNMVTEGWKPEGDVFVSALLMPYFPEGPLEAVHDMARNVRAAGSAHNEMRIRDAVEEASVVDLLPDVACPTLIIHARRDAVHPLDEARLLAARIVGAEMLILDSANHCPLPGSQHFDPFVAALLEFLGENSLAPT